jgi:HTH-type transcriptional regulator / antitoxin MqsA
MFKSTSNGRGRRCPVCGHGVLRSRLISEVFEYGDEGDSVLVQTEDVPVEDCDVRGESFSGPKAAVIRHEAIGRALGLLNPGDIQAIRERLGKSLDQSAKLIGASPNRLSQWEDGSVWQDRTADRLIRLIAAKADNVEHLESVIAISSGEVAPKETGEERPTKKPRRRAVRPGDRDQFDL